MWYKISPVGSLDYSQSTRVTDGQTGRLTDGQNYDSQDRASIASRGKNVNHKTVQTRVEHDSQNSGISNVVHTTVIPKGKSR